MDLALQRRSPNGMSSVRDADYVGVLMSNDIIIDDLKGIRIKCNTCGDLF